MKTLSPHSQYLRPHLWDGCIAAVAPQRQYGLADAWDDSLYQHRIDLRGIDSGDLVLQDGIPAIDVESANDEFLYLPTCDSQIDLPMSMVAWVRTDNAGTLASQRDDTDRGWQWWFSGNNLIFTINDGSWTNLYTHSGIRSSSLAFYGLVATKTGLTSYVEVFPFSGGLTSASTTYASKTIQYTTSVPLTIMARGGGLPTPGYEQDGAFVEYRLYNRALTEQEIVELAYRPHVSYEQAAPIYLKVPPSGGSISVTPAAAVAIATAVDPTVQLGSLTVVPADASAVATSNDPVVQLGGVSVTPANAPTYTAAINPTVSLGAISITPDVATAIATAVDPTVDAGGSVSVTPDSAIAIATAVDPTVVQASISVTPSQATAIATAVDPTVQSGGTTITPAVATSVAVAVDPTVTLGSVSVTPGDASSVATCVDPTVIQASISVSPVLASVVALAIDPTVSVVDGVDATIPGIEYHAKDTRLHYWVYDTRLHYHDHE